MNSLLHPFSCLSHHVGHSSVCFQIHSPACCALFHPYCKDLPILPSLLCKFGYFSPFVWAYEQRHQRGSSKPAELSGSWWCLRVSPWKKRPAQPRLGTSQPARSVRWSPIFLMSFTCSPRTHSSLESGGGGGCVRRTRACRSTTARFGCCPRARWPPRCPGLDPAS